MTDVVQEPWIGKTDPSGREFPENFDAVLIWNLIKWAEQDEEWKARFRSGEWLGHWSQAMWGAADDAIDEPGAGNFEGIIDTTTCGTAFCMAGQAVIQKGYRLVFNGRHAHHAIKVEPTGEVNHKGRKVYRDVPGETVQSVESLGAELLGITPYEASQFFNGSNTLRYLRARANGMCEQRGLPLLFPDNDVTTANYFAWA